MKSETKTSLTCDRIYKISPKHVDFMMNSKLSSETAGTNIFKMFDQTITNDNFLPQMNHRRHFLRMKREAFAGTRFYEVA